MKGRFALLIFIQCLVVTAMFASPIGQIELTESVSKLILKYYPDAEISQDNGNLVAKYGTMTFTVHGCSKIGRIFEKTKKVEGPNFKGFILCISVKNGKYGGQACVPQTLRRPYWQTYIDCPPTDDGEGYYAIDFSYGSSLDPKFMKAVLEVLSKIRMSTK
ncbi:MAG: hypothetical protein JW983_03475 [Elusimicrobia bacterium]|nr:hypothetical protein [Elusimicrobiota bacterium]